MPFSKEFEATPPPRQAAWASVQTYEGPLTAVLDSDYALIDSRAIPADPTPLVPDPLVFDVDTCVYETGLYRFRFLTGSGVPSPFSSPVRSPKLLTADYAPSLDDVGALARARTKDSGGHEIGTFNENTRPTGAEVLRLIAMATAEVATRVEEPILTGFADAARAVIALRTAMLIEISYFPEDLQANGSAYGRFRGQFDESLISLNTALQPTIPIV
ncbi:MAG: hypothetical protein JWM31_1263 [Solirubrobacterales bacterium]|nr:hypothetical protein [Solirubrobacterales bacterium]